MGFIKNEGVSNLQAKLTPIGKNTIINEGVKNVVSKFVLGDSDANYVTNKVITSSLISDTSFDSDSLYHNYQIKHKINYDVNSIYKNIGDENKVISDTNTYSDFSTYVNKLDNVYINKGVDNENLNVLKTISAPISENEILEFTSGKFSNTALKRINRSDYLVIPVDSFDGSIIDGQSINVRLDIGSKEINLYSAFSEGNNSPDDILMDNSSLVSAFSTNCVMLFSDDIAKPIADNTKSWGFGFKETTPYKKGKTQFNIFTPNNGGFGDTIVGYFLLDKGLIVIIDEYIISHREDIIETYVDGVMNYLNHKFEITCLINRNDFTLSTNPTYKAGSPIRVSEIGLYDDYNRLVGVAKFNEHLILDRTKPVVVSIVVNF